MDTLLSETYDRMNRVLEVLRVDLSTVRTGRATPSLVENIVINAYGGTAKLKVMELAHISVSDQKTLMITPFDLSITGEIQKGIMETNVGLTPVVDGAIIRISIPPMSSDRREQLVHLVNQKLEGGRIQVRQVRHEAFSEIKKAEIGEDELLRLEKEIQKLTDETILEIDALGKRKEEELLQI